MQRPGAELARPSAPRAERSLRSLPWVYIYLILVGVNRFGHEDCSSVMFPLRIFCVSLGGKVYTFNLMESVGGNP